MGAVLSACGLGIRMSLNVFDTQAYPSHNGEIYCHAKIGSFAY